MENVKVNLFNNTEEQDDFINELIKVNLSYFTRSDKYYENESITRIGAGKEYFENNKVKIIENIIFFRKLLRIANDRNLGSEVTKEFMKKKIKEWIKIKNFFSK